MADSKDHQDDIVTDRPPPDEGDESVSRRDVFGMVGLVAVGTIAGAAAGVVHKKIVERPKHDASGLALDKPWVPGAERYGRYEEKWFNTSCAQCPAGCGIRVRVVGGRAVRIEGNPENPLNRGGVGPRGLAGLQTLYDPDRIMGPLVRENGTLVPISWDKARAIVIEKLRALRLANKTHELLVMTGRERGFFYELLSRFCRVFGTPNFVDGTPSRTSVIAQAMEAMIGTYTRPSYDWTQVRYALSIEAGFLEDACQSVYLSRVAGLLRRSEDGQRATIVHAGSTFDLTGYNADDHLHIRPGTGGALALGICHVLIRDDLYDDTFVKEHTKGFEAFAKMVKENFSPEQTAAKTGTTKKLIEHIAHRLAERRPSFAFVDERSLGYTNGLDTAMAVLALDGLLGALGTIVRAEPQPPYADWPDPIIDATAKAGLERPRLDKARTKEYPRARSVHETLPDALVGEGKPSMLFVDHANPVWARAQPARWKKALEGIPFIVSFSPFRDETVDSVAHLVLPDHTYLESWDDASAAPGVGIPVAGIRRPVVDPVHDTRATGDFLLEVARLMGDPLASSFPWGNFRAAVDARMKGLHLARRGTIVEASERTFIARLYERGFWAETDPIFPPIDKVELFASWSDAEFAGDEATYPLKLIAYRPLGYSEGSGANQPWLRHVRGRPHVSFAGTPAYFHPDDAPELRSGDVVTVTSPFGSILVEAFPDPQGIRGAVAIPVGLGHEAFGRFAKGRGSNVRHLLGPGPAPKTGANMFGSTRVKLAKAVGGAK